MDDNSTVAGAQFNAVQNSAQSEAQPVQELEAEAQQTRLEVEARVRASVRILVIDHEVETADRVVVLLERAGYDAEIATDGASGLSLAERFQPHLVILGAISNHTSSTEFARALRASAHDIVHPDDEASASSVASSSPDVPILHLVDRAHLLQQRLQTLGSTPQSEAIFKPVDERELLDKVARALALKS